MPKHRRHRRRRIGVLTGVLAVGLGVGIGVSEAVGSGPEGFHTAAVTTGATAQTLTVSGTAEPAQESSASFQVAGTVTSVAVALGQHVTAGQTLATVDPTSLQEAVTVAQTTLASDEAALTENEDDQQSASGGSASSSDAQTTAAVRTTDSAVLTAAVSPGGSADLQQAQQAVVNAQHTADVAIQSAQADTQAAATACADSGSGTTTTTTTSTTTTSTTTTSTTTTTVPTGGSGTSAACTTALQLALSAENQVSGDQSNLESAENTLAQLLSATSSGATSTATSQPTGNTGSGSTGSGSASHSSAAANSAQQLASDEATIDSDEASLVEAQQNLAAATLASPLSGTVASVGITSGQTVTAGSTTDTITIIDPGAYEATSSLTSSQVGSVKVGDQVQATIDGTAGTLGGTVSRVGPVQESDSSYTYPVEVALDSTQSAVAAGSAAQLSIDLAQAANTLVVPTSAVHTQSSGHSYVDVLQNGNAREKTVTVGVVGPTYTQILSGLSTGERVVLADLSQAVPSSSTNSTTTGRFGGFPGGGFPVGGGGFPIGGGGSVKVSGGT